jgi:4-amino-4-deoxy-L-arabinose transferase-like glycosyltransferase
MNFGAGERVPWRRAHLATSRVAGDRVLEMSWRLALPAVMILAVVARLGVMLPQAKRPLDDPDNYLPLARALAAGQGFTINGHPTAYRPPLYPILLAPLVMVLGPHLSWGVFALHTALGAGTVWLTVLAARRWGLSPVQVLVAAVVVACDPALVVQGRSVMTETLAAFLLAAALAAVAGSTWRSAALGGLAYGLAALCRPSTLPAGGLTVVAALLARPGSARDRVERAGALAVATILVLVPWAWRNARELGEPVWTTTHGGYTLALANNPVYYSEVVYGPRGAVWSGGHQRAWFDRVNSQTAGMSEPEADRTLRSDALRFIAQHPVAFSHAALARLGRFWGVAPSGAVYPRWLRIATAVWTVPLWAALVLGLCRREQWAWPRVAAPMALLALSLVHAIYWTDLRMRAPLVPAIALIVAAGSPTVGPKRQGGVP